MAITPLTARPTSLRPADDSSSRPTTPEARPAFDSDKFTGAKGGLSAALLGGSAALRPEEAPVSAAVAELNLRFLNDLTDQARATWKGAEPEQAVLNLAQAILQNPNVSDHLKKIALNRLKASVPDGNEGVLQKLNFMRAPTSASTSTKPGPLPSRDELQLVYDQLLGRNPLGAADLPEGPVFARPNPSDLGLMGPKPDSLPEGPVFARPNPSDLGLMGPKPASLPEGPVFARPNPSDLGLMGPKPASLPEGPVFARPNPSDLGLLPRPNSKPTATAPATVVSRPTTSTVAELNQQLLRATAGAAHFIWKMPDSELPEGATRQSLFQGLAQTLLNHRFISTDMKRQVLDQLSASIPADQRTAVMQQLHAANSQVFAGTTGAQTWVIKPPAPGLDFSAQAGPQMLRDVYSQIFQTQFK